MDDLNLQPLLKTKRQQVSRACGNCRKAKTACSNHRPCQRCVKFNLQSSCEDAPRKQRANPDPKKPKSPRRTGASPIMASGLDDMEMDEPMSNSIEFLQNGMEPYQQPQFIQPQYHQQPQYYQQQTQYIPPYPTAPFPQPVSYAQYIQQTQFQQPYPPVNQPSYPPFQQPPPVVQPQSHYQTFPSQNQSDLLQSQTTTYQMSSDTSNGGQMEYSSVPEPPKPVLPEDNNPLGKLSVAASGNNGNNISFGSAGSLTELMQMRTPSLESLIVTVNSEITKKKKEDSFSSIPI